MKEARRFTIKIPKSIWSQIKQRAKVNSRSANGEAIYLLRYAMERVDGMDVHLTLDRSDEFHTGLYMPQDFFNTLEARAHMFERSTGPEIVRLLVFAIDDITKAQLRVIWKMVNQDGAPEGQSLPGAPRAEMVASQPVS